MTHPPVELLIQHALGMSTSEAAHIVGCVDCAEEVEELAAIGREAPRLSPPTELIELSTRFDEEKAAAQEMLKNTGVEELRRALRSSPTAGGVQTLIEAIPAVRREDPAGALEIAEELVHVLEHAPAASSLALAEEMRVDALREVAASARVLGQYDRALEQLNKAEILAHDLPAGEYLLARIWYERAGIEVSREGSTTRDWATRAADAFVRYGDTRRYNRSRYLIAISHSNDRDYRETIEELDRLLPLLEADGDLETQAAAWSALGQAHSREGSLDRCSEALSQSLRLYQTLNLPSESLRAQWALARADMRRGDVAGARFEIERIRESFRQLGLTEEASLAALDLCECLVIEGSVQVAARVCKEALEVLQTRFSGREQLRAIAYLQEIASHRLDAQKVNHVSSFLEDSMSDDSLIFSRPSL